MRQSDITIRDWRNLPATVSGDAIIFDVFRCSTTLQSLLSKDCENVMVTQSLDKIKTLCSDFRIFSELPEVVACRKRFDNSPASAESQIDFSANNLVATTSGTPAIFAARNFDRVFIGSLANFSSIVRLLQNKTAPITLLPAAKPDSTDVEDGIVAEQIAIALDGYATDSAFVRACAEQAKAKIESSGRIQYLEDKLETGVRDMKICMDIDRFDFVPILNFEPWCNIPGLARVTK